MSRFVGSLISTLLAFPLEALVLLVGAVVSDSLPVLADLVPAQAVVVPELALVALVTVALVTVALVTVVPLLEAVVLVLLRVLRRLQAEVDRTPRLAVAPLPRNFDALKRLTKASLRRGLFYVALLQPWMLAFKGTQTIVLSGGVDCLEVQTPSLQFYAFLTLLFVGVHHALTFVSQFERSWMVPVADEPFSPRSNTVGLRGYPKRRPAVFATQRTCGPFHAILSFPLATSSLTRAFGKRRVGVMA